MGRQIGVADGLDGAERGKFGGEGARLGAVAIGDPSVSNGQGAFAGGFNSIATADGTATGAAANGAIVGGRSVADGSLEMRVRATQTIGFVAFVDAGQAFAGGAPDFSRPLGASVGLGLRYFTSFGPLRLDIATPIERRSGDRPFAIYASVGQAF